MTETTTDGGVVLSLFLMVAAITYAMFTAIKVYVDNKDAKDSTETPTQTLVRTFSAWANIGNSLVHVLLIIYIKVNEGSEDAYWVREKELEADGIGGPLGLAILNFAAGMCSIHQKHLTFPLVWNSFVIIAGTMLPLVWLRFVEEGLSTWPYFIIFVWWAIFSMELSAFATSWTYYSIKPKEKAE
jgi:magnesium-transporting ATPase (P-type)